MHLVSGPSNFSILENSIFLREREYIGIQLPVCAIQEKELHDLLMELAGSTLAIREKEYPNGYLPQEKIDQLLMGTNEPIPR